MVSAHWVVGAVFIDPDQAVSGPEVFSDQRGRARDIIIVILRDPVAPDVMHRVDRVARRLTPDHLLTKAVVLVIGLLNTTERHRSHPVRRVIGAIPIWANGMKRFITVIGIFQMLWKGSAPSQLLDIITGHKTVDQVG